MFFYAGNFILDQCHMVAVSVRNVRRGQSFIILHARHGRVGDAVRQSINAIFARVRVRIFHKSAVRAIRRFSK